MIFYHAAAQIATTFLCFGGILQIKSLIYGEKPQHFGHHLLPGQLRQGLAVQLDLAPVALGALRHGFRSHPVRLEVDDRQPLRRLEAAVHHALQQHGFRLRHAGLVAAGRHQHGEFELPPQIGGTPGRPAHV